MIEAGRDARFEDLRKRVEQFHLLELPGQPQGMHMGTAYLVDALWREINFLRGCLGWPS
jgi:hypothetical protein